MPEQHSRWHRHCRAILIADFFDARFAALSPESQPQACWEQLRAGLRRKEGIL